MANIQLIRVEVRHTESIRTMALAGVALALLTVWVWKARDGRDVT
jgi:DNA-binding transcriptional LysR family regulator